MIEVKSRIAFDGVRKQPLGAPLLLHSARLRGIGQFSAIE
jgi:hypothetical protein